MNRIEFRMPRFRERNAEVSFEATVPPKVRAPRIARLLALAHKLDELLLSGTVRDYAALARLGGISRSRLFQIQIFLNLSPAIQEQVLFLTAAEARSINERDLRAIAREANWNRQQERFQSLRRTHR